MPLCINYEEQRCASCSFLGDQAHTAEAPAFARAAAYKQALFFDRVRDILGPELLKIARPLFCPASIFPSRAKAKVSVSGTLDDPRIGLLDNSYRGVELLDCPLHFPLLNQLMAAIKALIKPYKLFPYDVSSRRGELKGLILLTNRQQTEALVRFVLRSTEAVPRVRKAIDKLRGIFPQLKAASINIQPLPAAILEGPTEILLTENRYIWEDYGCCRTALQPQCFVQVTPETAASLYQHVAAWAKSKHAQRVLDLYCGAGAFLLACAAEIAEGRGFELSQTAVESARHGADAAGVKNAAFSSADVESLSLLPDGFNPDFLILNPPRRGLTSSVRESVLRWRPRYVVYSSCNPETQFRDLAELLQSYALLELAPFDMFPLTAHLESAALLELR